MCSSASSCGLRRQSCLRGVGLTVRFSFINDICATLNTALGVCMFLHRWCVHRVFLTHFYSLGYHPNHGREAFLFLVCKAEGVWSLEQGGPSPHVAHTPGSREEGYLIVAAAVTSPFPGSLGKCCWGGNGASRTVTWPACLGRALGSGTCL